MPARRAARAQEPEILLRTGERFHPTSGVKVSATTACARPVPARGPKLGGDSSGLLGLGHGIVTSASGTNGAAWWLLEIEAQWSHSGL